jgi:hypothetical protein
MSKEILIEAAHNHYYRAEAYKELLLGLIAASVNVDRYIPRTVDLFQEHLSDVVTAMTLMDLGEEE